MGWIIELATCGITGERKMEEAMLHELATSNSFSDSKDVDHDGKTAHDLKLFSFDSIVVASNNFSSENKLGEGGFGPVYKVIRISLSHSM